MLNTAEPTRIMLLNINQIELHVQTFLAFLYPDFTELIQLTTKYNYD
jgi:hypothetical protein